MKALVLLLATGAVALAAETEIPVSKLPAPVRSAIQKLVGTGTVRKTVQEPGDKGGTIYEVAYTLDGRKYEAEISPAGKVLVVDREVALSEVPAPVRKTIEESTVGGKVTKVERAEEGRETYFEAEFRRAGKEHEVKVAPDGKVLKLE